MAPQNFPLPIQQALDFVPSFIASIIRSRPGCVRAMRPERQDAFEKLLPELICGCSLQHDGAICAINGDWVRPKTVDEMAANAGINKASAVRVLSDLRSMGYIESKQIKRKNPVTGQLEVSPGLRFFTEKFWRELGLWDLFKQSVEWAKKHCKRVFLMPFKGIIKKAKKNLVAAGEVVGAVLKVMTPEQNRTKFWCNKIIENIRQKK